MLSIPRIFVSFPPCTRKCVFRRSIQSNDSLCSFEPSTVWHAGNRRMESSWFPFLRSTQRSSVTAHVKWCLRWSLKCWAPPRDSVAVKFLPRLIIFREQIERGKKKSPFQSQSRDTCRLLSRCKDSFPVTHRNHLLETWIKLQAISVMNSALCSAHSQNLWLNYEKKTYLFWDITTLG